MKKIFLLRYFLLITFLGIGIGQLKSQPYHHLTKEDFTSIESLSKALCKNINKDEKKVKAIHKWITHSIDYDFDLIIDVRPHFEYSSEEVFLTGKSMSEGYVNLMQSMLQVHNIPSQKVIGYTRLYNTDSALLPVYNDHAWIAIYLNGQWQLADPTKDAGYIGYRRTNKVDKVNKMKREWRQERDKKMAHFESSPSIWKLPGVIWNALKG